MKFSRWKYIFCLLLASAVHAPAYAQDAPSADQIASLFSGGGGLVRGTVTAVSGKLLQVKTAQGVTYKIETGANTFFRRDRQPIPSSDIHAGDMILSGGELDSKTKTLGAVFVAIVSAQQMQELQQRQADFGKTWLAGTVAAIVGTKITITRPDKKTQTIAVDEDTSFRRNRDSIILPDIKAGNHVYARGAIENGVFTAKVLTVVEPREGRNVGRPGAGDEAGPQR